ncbi:MAG TPA: GFA family protein [Caulobacterales bacterium]|nr:GFA family protein [Caulobacterales bacterium]
MPWLGLLIAGLVLAAAGGVGLINQIDFVGSTACLNLSNTITCNCSRCRRLGSILAFAPWDQFTLTKGEDATTTFKFNKHAIYHKFCKTCGIQSPRRRAGRRGDGRDQRALPG